MYNEVGQPGNHDARSQHLLPHNGRAAGRRGKGTGGVLQGNVNGAVQNGGQGRRRHGQVQSLQ